MAETELTREKPPRTIAFHTLGCRLNSSDTQRLEEEALARGMRLVAFNEKADVYVVNTCTVTSQADRQCRRASRQARARNPDAEVVLLGCYVQAQPQAAADLEAPSLLLDNYEKDTLFEHVEARSRVSLPVVGATDVAALSPASRPGSPLACDDASFESELSQGVFRRRRAFLKVQDGCGEKCSYCIIPKSRGPSRSRSSEAILHEARSRLDAGYQELVVVGVHLSEWGIDDGKSLASLLRQLCELDGLTRVRVSSLEPEGLTDELIDAFAHPKVCNHLHVSVQSGAPRILRAMRRNYQPADVRDAVARASAALPDLALGSDFIAGFPGERERDFADTMALVNELPFSYVHAFPYSERPGTDAAAMPSRVPVQERGRRVKELNALGKRKKTAFAKARIGRTYRTWLYSGAPGSGNTLRGLTGNFLTVSLPGSPALINTFSEVRLTALEAGQLMGELVAC